MRSYLVAAIVATFAATAVQAADEVLICQITITKGTSQSTVQRRYEINFDSNAVGQYMNEGRGWDAEGTLTLVTADNDRIIFSGGGIQQSNIDRETGEYYQEDNYGKARGKCTRKGGKPLPL
jgi:hypothetical protein